MLIEPVCIQARKLLEKYLLEHNMTPTDLSREVSCNQSTVQRFLASRTKTITPAIRKILIHAGIDENDCINASVRNPFDNAQIRQALAQVWDGQDETAQKLAKLIAAVAPLVDLERTTTGS
jgi:primosomal protein N''